MKNRNMELISEGNSIRIKEGNKISPAYRYTNVKEKFKVVKISEIKGTRYFEILYKNVKWKKKMVSKKFLVVGDTITFID